MGADAVLKIDKWCENIDENLQFASQTFNSKDICDKIISLHPCERRCALAISMEDATCKGDMPPVPRTSQPAPREINSLASAATGKLHEKMSYLA
jgi:hypothetical protein